MITEPQGVFKGRPRGLLRLFFKAPLILHRLGLVWWIEKFSGAQWMLITTIGRKSGKPRQVMVDVVDYDKEADTFFVVSAYGQRADWVRNIQANPDFRAQVGRRKFPASAEFLPPEIAEEKLIAQMRRAPRYAKAVMALGGLKYKDEAGLRALSRKMVLLAIHPQKQKG
ncbi:MAG: nitroreductase family deazaflavin-dependent oxidoreductase [Anaerolineales bacterium]|nr:nitroreductase family deazaflavin-dependent oxidoreductase [Anaerolineales bacterium]